MLSSLVDVVQFGNVIRIAAAERLADHSVDAIPLPPTPGPCARPGPAAAAMSHRSIIHLIIIAALGNNNNNNNTRAKTLKAKPSKACAMCYNAKKYSD